VSQPVDSNHASEEALLVYALWPETIQEATAQHIRQCKTCMSEVTDIRSLQRALKIKLARFDCPSAERLTAYALRELPLWERAEIKFHARNCPNCTEEIRATQLASEVLPSPLLWQNAARIFASLDFNLQRSVRAIEDEGEPHQMLQRFVAGDTEVNLGRFEDEGGASILSGKISQGEAAPPAPTPTPLAVRLLRVIVDQPPELVDETPLGPDNFFELGPVPPGTYQLEVLFSDRLLEIGELTL
jgi:Putative zinc-finger